MKNGFHLRFGIALLFSIGVLGAFMVLRTVFAADVITSVTVGNAAPVVSAVTLNSSNGGSDITLTANATTAITVSFTITDQNGCTDVIENGNATITVFRTPTGVGFECTADNLNCYRVVTSTSHDCSGAATSTNATATVEVYYFADATDASSSYASDDWSALIQAQDLELSSSSASSTHVELNTLVALETSTTTIEYGTLTAGTDTGSTNHIVTSTNAGNASTTLQLVASSTLVSGANSLATSSQHYATGTFTFGGVEAQLSETLSTVDGFFLAQPTTTTNVAMETFWGVEVIGGSASGTYSGETTFSALYSADVP